MTEPEIRAALTPIQVLACTMWGEARGDQKQGGSSLEERVAVGCVIRNRLRTPNRYGDTYRDVCLAPRQFSCWNLGGSNHEALIRVAYRLVTGQPTMDDVLDETRYLAEGIVQGVILDRVKQATHFYAPLAMKPPGRVPDWAEGKIPVIVGSQLFFVDI